jgi:hypothetical protein
MATGHNVKTLDCPNLDAFVATSLGAVIRWLSELPVLVFSEGGRLLIAQAITGLTSTVGGFALGLARQRSLPGRSLTITLKCPLPHSQILHLLQSSHPT